MTTAVPTRADLLALRQANPALKSALLLIKQMVVAANALGQTRLSPISIFSDGVYTGPSGDTVTLNQVAVAIRAIPGTPTVGGEETGVFLTLDWS